MQDPPSSEEAKVLFLPGGPVRPAQLVAGRYIPIVQGAHRRHTVPTYARREWEMYILEEMQDLAIYIHILHEAQRRAEVSFTAPY